MKTLMLIALGVNSCMMTTFQYDPNAVYLGEYEVARNIAKRDLDHYKCRDGGPLMCTSYGANSYTCDCHSTLHFP